MNRIKANIINPFVLNAPFLYSLRTSKNLKVFWCFQGIEKGCIGKRWVNTTWKSEHRNEFFLRWSLTCTHNLWLKKCEPEPSNIIAEIFHMCLQESCFQIAARSHLWFKEVGERSMASKLYIIALLITSRNVAFPLFSGMVSV